MFIILTKMKTYKSIIFVTLLIVQVLLSACYEPVANTSDDFSEDSPETISETNTSTDVTNKSENLETNTASEPENTSMTETTKTETKTAVGFRANLEQKLSQHGLSISTVANESSPVEKRILNEYGAVFLTKATPPDKTMFTSDSEVNAFQSKAGSSSESIGGATIELQTAAMEALKKAIAEAKQSGVKITPRDGAEAAKRSYKKTLDLWNSRFEPALKHWKSKKRLTDEQISRLKSLPIKQQVQEVLELEKQGIYFNTFFNNSILYSVAAPGTSQHLSMLAFDATEFGNKKVRQIMAKHGWFRTVQNDEPHFTYLGYQESELPRLGLKKVTKKGGEFWVPDV